LFDLCKSFISPTFWHIQTPTKPLARFRNLQKIDRAVALETFEKYKEFYHPICRAMVEKDLFGKKDN